MNKQLITAGILATAISFSACNNDAKQTNDAEQTEAAETTSEWIDLFDGKSLAGWHGFNKTEKVTNWIVEDSALVCLGAAEWDTGGDIVSEKEFGNFELMWDWKLEAGSNSGVMYHVIEDEKYKGPFETGPEYQMIDDEGWDGELEDWQETGADYAMNVASKDKKVKPIGEWNSSKIVYNNGHVEHWLNGDKVVDFEVGTDEWNKEKAEGKWKDFPDYATVKHGKIALQDHGKKAYFKNIKIREL